MRLWPGMCCLLLYPLRLDAQTLSIPPLYQQVAQQVKVPTERLFCIALQESQRKLPGFTKPLPWPWTLNIQGKGHYFDSRQAAESALTQALKRTRSIDVGLMQLSVRYQAQRFQVVTHMLDPVVNLKTGAVILRENYERFGDWATATGKYHSYGNSVAQRQRAQAYEKKVGQRCQPYR